MANSGSLEQQLKILPSVMFSIFVVSVLLRHKRNHLLTVLSHAILLAGRKLPLQLIVS